MNSELNAQAEAALEALAEAAVIAWREGNVHPEDVRDVFAALALIGG